MRWAEWTLTRKKRQPDKNFNLVDDTIRPAKIYDLLETQVELWEKTFYDFDEVSVVDARVSFLRFAARARGT